MNIENIEIQTDCIKIIKIYKIQILNNEYFFDLSKIR